MSINAIIVSYQTGPALKECIKKVLSSAMIDGLILVDNGNTADMRAWMDAVVKKNPTMKIIRGQGNVGFARACNAGAQQAKGTHLLFLNPDALLQKNAVKQLQEVLDKAPNGSVVGARLQNPDGSEQRGSRRGRLTPWSALVSMTGLSRFAPAHRAFADMHQEAEPLPGCPIAVHAISGACMLIRRNDFIALGGFDEGYFLHVEDLDICRRVRKRGGDVIFVPGARVVHYGSTSKASRLKIDWNKAIGLVRYFYKFSHSALERLGAILLAPFIVAAILSRSLLIWIKERFF